MPHILYHGAPQGPSLSVLAALFETGVDAELHAIDLTAGARHRAPVPQAPEIAFAVEGEGPVLVADGVAMSESVFIACYLDELAGEGKLRPTEPYARWETMAWCRWFTERVAPAAALLGAERYLAPRLAAMADGDFAGLTGAIESDDLRGRWEDTRAGRVSDAARADSEAKVRAGADKVEARLADGRAWIEEQFGIADIESFAWLNGMQEIVPDAFAGRPNLARWMAAVAARPSVARALALGGADAARQWSPGPEINRWG